MTSDDETINGMRPAREVGDVLGALLRKDPNVAHVSPSWRVYKKVSSAVLSGSQRGQS